MLAFSFPTPSRSFFWSAFTCPLFCLSREIFTLLSAFITIRASRDDARFHSMLDLPSARLDELWIYISLRMQCSQHHNAGGCTDTLSSYV